MKSSFLFKTSVEKRGAQGPDLALVEGVRGFLGLCMLAGMTSCPSDLSLIISLLMGCALKTHVD